MAKASFNIQQASRNAFFHNSREAVVTYTIDDKSRNQTDKNAREAIKYYLQLLKEATENYTARTGQKIQTKEEKFLWEAVVNLNEEHTLQDVQKLARELEEKFGWQPVQIAVHRDEGHISKTGKKIYNYHAHIIFFMLSKDGIYRFKKRDFGKKKMAQIQTLVAETLGMERGVDKRISGRTRLEHRQFKQSKKKEEELIEKLERKEKEIQEIKQKNELTVKALKQQIEALRKELIEKNKQYKIYTQEDYKALSELKKAAKKDNVQEVLQAFLRLQEHLRAKEKELIKEVEERRRVEQKNRELKQKVQELQEKIEKLEKELQERRRAQERQKIRKEFNELRRELKALLKATAEATGYNMPIATLAQNIAYNIVAEIEAEEMERHNRPNRPSRGPSPSI